MKLPTIYLLLFIIIYSNCSQCSDFIFGENFEGDYYLTCNNLATSNPLFNCFLKDDYSGCVEKECKDMEPYYCQEFISKDNLKKCIVNPQSEKCQLFTCSELNKNFCYQFGYVDDKFCIQTEGGGCELKTCEESSNNCGVFRPKGNKYCVYKKNSDGSISGCEYKSCEELSSGNCNSIFFSSFGNNIDYDAVCADNNDGHCVTKNCSLLTENCENLILENPGYKCISDGNGKCFPTKKNCEEIDRFRCSSYMKSDEDMDLRRLCIKNTDNTSCILRSCEDLSSSECNKYNEGGTFNYEKCIVDGEKCKLIDCEELTKDKCDVFGYYANKKCVPSGNNCKLAGCINMPPDQCESFILENPLYKCTNKANFCTEFVKDCEELPVDLCSSFYNYFDDNKICVQSEDNKRCELKDRNWEKEDNKNKSNIIKFSFYFIGLLSLF